MALKRTPFYQIHKSNNAQIVEFAGWEMPVKFSNIIDEHINVREKAGIFDVSHMGEIMIEGDAQSFTEYLIANNVSKLSEHQVCYSPMCNERGTIIDDLLCYKFSEKKILLVVNASNIEKDYAHISDIAKRFNVKVENISDRTAQIAVQGPNAESIVNRALNTDLSNVGFFHFTVMDHNNASVIISRTGYTGEDGFELYLPADNADKLWNSIMESGRNEGLLPIGLAARDTLRFEAKLMLYGNDIDDNTTPIEAGLKWTVDTEKGFIGRDVIMKQIEENPKKYLVGFEMIDRSVPRHGYNIFIDNKKSGIVTSGCFAPYLKQYLGLGYVDWDHRRSGNEISIEIRDNLKKAVTVKTPFYKKQYKK